MQIGTFSGQLISCHGFATLCNVNGTKSTSGRDTALHTTVIKKLGYYSYYAIDSGMNNWRWNESIAVAIEAEMKEKWRIYAFFC